MEGARNYNGWIVAAFARYLGTSVLEVGVGHGGFYEQLPGVRRYTGLDIDRKIVARAQARHPELTYVQGDVADPGLPDRLGRGSVDSALCVNVLEHVPDDRAAVANLLELVRPGGHVLLFVPAFPALYNDLDRLAGHQRRYTRGRLRDLLPPGRAEVRVLEYFNPLGAVGWGLNRFLPHPSLETRRVLRQVSFFDRYLLPVSRLLNPVTRFGFGQSLVCVLRRL